METKQNNHVLKLLQEAEQKLQEVIAVTAMAGDYVTSRLTSEVAKQIQQLKSDFYPDASQGSVGNEPASSSASKQYTKKSKSKGRQKYPKFEIRNSVLFRIGWSKKEKKEYNHKVKKPVYDSTIEALVSVSQSCNSPIMAEQVIEKLNKSDLDHTPSYQVYLVIGFLREFGCIKQIGREGYEVTEGFEERAHDLWQDIANEAIN